MKRKIFNLILIFVLVVLSGCNNITDNRKTISFSTWGSQSEISTIKELIKDFETENPEIKVNLIHIPDNYFQKLHLLIASNLAPDVIFINNLNSKIYIDAKKFEPLNHYIENSSKLSKKDFLNNALIPLSNNGIIYAIPRDVSNLVIYYNKDLFNKYNIPYPNKNWNYDEFLKTAQALTKDTNNDGKIDIFGFGFEKNSLFWLPFLLSNNGGIISQDGENIIINNENSLNSIQWYADLRNKYHIAPKQDEQSSLTTSQMFIQGKVAMHICGRWCSLTYKKNKNLNWDIISLPNGKNNSVVTIDTSGWAISSSSKYKQESWKFIEFMTSDKSMEKMTQSGLIIPSTKKIAYSKTFLHPPPQNAKIFLDIINTGIPTPTCQKYAEINDLLNEKLELAFNGKKNVNDIIDTETILKLNRLVKNNEDK